MLIDRKKPVIWSTMEFPANHIIDMVKEAMKAYYPVKDVRFYGLFFIPKIEL